MSMLAYSFQEKTHSYLRAFYRQAAPNRAYSFFKFEEKFQPTRLLESWEYLFGDTYFSQLKPKKVSSKAKIDIFLPFYVNQLFSAKVTMDRTFLPHKNTKYCPDCPNGSKLQIRFANLDVHISLYYSSREAFCNISWYFRIKNTLNTHFNKNIVHTTYKIIESSNFYPRWLQVYQISDCFILRFVR